MNDNVRGIAVRRKKQQIRKDFQFLLYSFIFKIDNLDEMSDTMRC